MKLRYYADSSYEDDHETVLELLREINSRWDVPVEITRIRERHGPIHRFPGPIEEGSIEDAFENDFEYNRDLSENTGHTPKDAYQTKGGLITIAGCVGIVNAGLQWATMLSGEPPETHDGGANDTYSISFLRQVLEEGPTAMEEKITADALTEDGSDERGIFGEFLDGDHVDVPATGRVYEEERVGVSTVIKDEMSAGARRAARQVGTRSVDALIEADHHWVIEVKEEFNADEFDAALGEVLVSDELYRSDEGLDESDTTMALVFGEFPAGIKLSDEPEVLAESVRTARKYEVEVFVGVEPDRFGQDAREFLHLTERSEILQEP